MPDTPSPPTTVLGFDFGKARIGVAVGQTITGTATALEIVPAKEGIPDWQTLEKLIREWRPQLLIVGLPLNLDGQEQEMSRAARKFGNRLHGRFGLQVEMVDERLTSRAAESNFVQLRQQGSARRKDVKKLDAVAASLIVESWLAQQGMGT